MIECLIKRDGGGDFDVRDDVLEPAIRPSVPHTVGPGRWTIDVGGDRFVDFSAEPPGLQISFDDAIDRALAERVAADVVDNLAAHSGDSFVVVWLS